MQADFSAGLYGNPQDPETILTFWKDRESMNYPNAKRQVSRWTKKVEELKAQQQAMMQAQQTMMQQQAEMIQGAPQGMPPAGATIGEPEGEVEDEMLAM